MNKQWMSLVAGISYFVNAALFLGVSLNAWILYFRYPPLPTNPDGGWGFIIAIILTVLAIPAGLIALIGGIFAIKRRKWGLVIAASIVVLLLSAGLLNIVANFDNRFTILFILPILSIVLTVLSKKQFMNKPATKNLSTGNL